MGRALTWSAALAAAVAVGLSGCGGSSQSSSGGGSPGSSASSGPPSVSTFKSGFAADKAKFKPVGAAIGQALAHPEGKTDAQLQAEFAALATQVSAAQSQFAQLSPPARYRAEFQRYLSGLGTIAGDLRALSAAAGQHSAPAYRSHALQLVADARQVRAVDVTLSGQLGLPAS